MTHFRLSPEAAQDIIDIYEFVAQHSVDAAEEVRNEVFEAIVGLTAFPGKGHRRADLTKQPVLFWPVRSYQIIYRPESTLLEIVAVLHGKRNIKRILQKR